MLTSQVSALFFFCHTESTVTAMLSTILSFAPFIPFILSSPTPPSSSQLLPRSLPPPYNQGQCNLQILVRRVEKVDGPFDYKIDDLQMFDNSNRPIGALAQNSVNAIHHIEIPCVLEQPLQVQTGNRMTFQVGDDMWTTDGKNPNSGASCNYPGFPQVGDNVQFACTFPCFYGGGAPSDTNVKWDGTKWVYPERYGAGEKPAIP